MEARKRTVTQEPLLSVVARKLGYAAGRLTTATQELTENLSAIPQNVTAKVREAANVSAPAGRSRARSRHPKKRIRRITRTQDTASSKSQKLPKSKSSRSGPKVSNVKK